MLKISSSLLAGLSLVASASPNSSSGESAPLDPASFSSVGRVDERFQSYNVEMAEVIGGRFWKPYAHMSTTNAPPTQIDMGRDPNLFEALPPADLSNTRLRALAGALGPAYVRVSGTWANSAYFQDDDAPAISNPPNGYSGVLTRAEWRGVVDFAKAVDAKLVTSFTIGAGVRDANGVWTPVEAKPLLDYTHSIGGEIFAAELFNEPNLAGYGAKLKGYDAAAYARDVAVFRTLLDQDAPHLKVLGPGDATTANVSIPGAPTTEDFLAASPPPRYDIFSYHFYPAVSQRCAPPGDARIGASEDQALTDAWLARTDRAFAEHKAARDRHVPDAPIWITETAQAACGGSPWAATFTDTFRYLDQMGRLAKQGVSVIFHNTLAASEYGLIDPVGLRPRPNYWAALLWRRLMGTVVLDPGSVPAGLHVYAQCQRDQSGGVTLLAINTGAQSVQLKVKGSLTEVYSLSASSLKSDTVLLNSRPLTLGADNLIPEIHPRRINGMHMTVAPQSIDFIALPRSRNPACQ
jgi:heparanase